MLERIKAAALLAALCAGILLLCITAYAVIGMGMDNGSLQVLINAVGSVTSTSIGAY